jgi:hypothetical protein
MIMEDFNCHQSGLEKKNREKHGDKLALEWTLRYWQEKEEYMIRHEL